MSLEDSRNEYVEYVSKLELLGCSKKPQTIKEFDNSCIVKHDIKQNDTNSIIELICPYGQLVAVLGWFQSSNPHSISLDIFDENGKELPDDTEIRIIKFSEISPKYQCQTPFSVPLAILNYKDLKSNNKDVNDLYGRRNANRLFTFNRGFELKYNCLDSLKIFIIRSPTNVPKENINFNMEFDVWTKTRGSYVTICNHCGKERPNMLILNTDIFTISEYLDFKENNEGLCIECFVDKKRKNRYSKR